MNLADIRKKAEENRKSATAATCGAINLSAGAQVFTPAIEVSPPAEIEKPLKAREGDSSVDEVLNLELNSPDDNYFPCNDIVPAGLPEVREKAGSSIEMSQSFPAQAVPVSKKTVVFNPLETILSGRDSAVDEEENSIYQANSYSAEDIEEYLCFRVGNEAYAISIMAIKEIIKPREVTEVPRMPIFISGVISLRGLIIPVMDMRIRLSLPTSATAGRERIVVLRKETGFCGILVDEVIQVARIKRVDIEEPPAVLDGIDRDFVTGLGHFDSRLLIILNLHTVLDIGIH